MGYIISIMIGGLLIAWIILLVASRKKDPGEATGNDDHGLSPEQPQSEGTPAPLARDKR